MAEVVVAPEGRGGTPPSLGHAGLALADRAARPGAHVVQKRQMATAVVAHYILNIYLVPPLKSSRKG